MGFWAMPDWGRPVRGRPLTASTPRRAIGFVVLIAFLWFCWLCSCCTAFIAFVSSRRCSRTFGWFIHCAGFPVEDDGEDAEDHRRKGGEDRCRQPRHSE